MSRSIRRLTITSLTLAATAAAAQAASPASGNLQPIQAQAADDRLLVADSNFLERIFETRFKFRSGNGKRWISNSNSSSNASPPSAS